MARITPDPTFYATAREAAAAQPERLGYVVTLNPDAATGTNGDGPGGLFLHHHGALDVKRTLEHDRGPQQLAYDFWWHLGHNTLISSEWGTPNIVEGGVNPEILLSNWYGHQLHIWDLDARTHKQTIDLGAEHQMVLELRP